MKRKELVFIVILIFLSNLYPQTEFTIGVENISYFPQYKGENGVWKGYGKEILEAFAKKNGYSFKYKILPVKRLFRSFLNEDVDFKYPDNPYWSEQSKKGKEIAYSNSVVKYIDGISVLPGNKNKGIDSIRNLGIVMGFTAWEYLNDIKSGKIKLKENSNFIGLVKQGLAGRVDGVYGNVAVVNYLLSKKLNNTNGLVFDESLPHTKSSYYLSSIKYKKVILEFNKFLEEEEDFIDKIKTKYKVGEKRYNY